MPSSGSFYLMKIFMDYGHGYCLSERKKNRTQIEQKVWELWMFSQSPNYINGLVYSFDIKLEYMQYSICELWNAIYSKHMSIVNLLFFFILQPAGTNVKVTPNTFSETTSTKSRGRPEPCETGHPTNQTFKTIVDCSREIYKTQKSVL
jgi:hypothetical protein